MSTVKTVESAGGDHVFALPVGYVMHEYEVRGVLGHGGFGITYLALDKQLNELVAIKEYLPSYMAVRFSNTTVGPKSNDDKGPFREGVQAFLKEAQTIVLFRHQNIVQVRRFFELNGTGYIVMTYEDGVPLSKMMAEGPIAGAELRQIMLGVLAGLEAIHARAKLHRDIKPSNIIVRPDGNPVLIDFGSARDYQNLGSHPMTAIMSPGYAPPEQYIGGSEQGPWTDFYALGASAYHCVTGKIPQDASYRADILRGKGKDPLVPAERAGVGRYDAELLKAIDWMLRPNKAERPKTAADIRALIDLKTSPPPLDLVMEKPPGRPAWTWIAAGLAAVLLVAAGAFFAPRWPGAHNEDAQYEAAQNDIDGLNSYLRTCRDCRFKDDAERRLAQLYAEALRSARFDRGKLETFMSICGTTCPGDLRLEGQARLDTFDAEKTQYQSAKDDIVRLEAYIDNCRGCEFRDDAERRLAQLHADRLRSIGFDRAKLEKFVTDCGLNCPGDLRRGAQTRLDTLDTEKTQYRSSQDDIARLEAYIDNCRGCEFRDEAERRLRDLRSKAAVVTPKPVVTPVEEPKKTPDVVPPRRDPDDEYQKTVRLDTIEGYQTFLHDFPDYPKNGTIRTLLERKQEETLWNEAELSSRDDEKKKLCDRLLILYPQGIHAEEARKCLAARTPDPQVPSPSQETDSCYSVTGLDPNGYNWLALRTAPNSQAPWSPTHLGPGTKMTLLERSGEWMHVRLDSGETGWANSKFVESCRTSAIPETPVSPPTSSCVVTGLGNVGPDNWLAVRNAPRRDAPWSTTHMYNGTPLTVLERSGEWFHVRLNSGETGWSNSKYIACR